MKLLHLSLGGKLSSLAFFSLRQSKPPTEYSYIFNSNCSEANVVQYKSSSSFICHPADFRYCRDVSSLSVLLLDWRPLLFRENKNTVIAALVARHGSHFNAMQKVKDILSTAAEVHHAVPFFTFPLILLESHQCAHMTVTQISWTAYGLNPKEG